MGSDLETSILRTTAYFSYFSYPLTAFELWKWLLNPTLPYSYREVLEALQTSEFLEKKLSRASGFLGFGDVTSQINDRSRRLVNALQKYATVSKYLAYLSRLPAIQGVAVCNSLAFHHTTNESDIDLFIITKPGQTWTARFLAAVPLILFRRRPGEAKTDPICLSFFASQSALKLADVRIGEQDPYLAFWSMTLMPLFDRSLWQRQFHEDNRWVGEYLPNAHGVKRARAFRVNERRLSLPSVLSEKLLKKVQEDRLPRHMRAMMNIDTRVIVTDDMLKFHDRDSREEIKLALDERMNALI
ncbi:MAG: hypothetical protein WC813_03760 [Patescibacteria group bacterium]|jgi:hypothetical protein